jgi:hypothetical protein
VPPITASTCPPVAPCLQSNLTRLSVHLEIAAFSDFFKADYDNATYAAMEAGPFYPPAFAHHWHNTYEAGIPERSWAGILLRRHARLLAEKPC